MVRQTIENKIYSVTFKFRYINKNIIYCSKRGILNSRWEINNAS